MTIDTTLKCILRGIDDEQLKYLCTLLLEIPHLQETCHREADVLSKWNEKKSIQQNAEDEDKDEVKYEDEGDDDTVQSQTRLLLPDEYNKLKTRRSELSSQLEAMQALLQPIIDEDSSANWPMEEGQPLTQEEIQTMKEALIENKRMLEIKVHELEIASLKNKMMEEENKMKVAEIKKKKDAEIKIKSSRRK
jgi:hypothetical protein